MRKINWDWVPRSFPHIRTQYSCAVFDPKVPFWLSNKKFKTTQDAIDYVGNPTGYEIRKYAGTELLNNPLTWAEGLKLRGDSWNYAIYKANATMDRMLDIRTVRFAHLSSVKFNGEDLANICIDGSNPQAAGYGWVPLHYFHQVHVIGAKNALMDLTGCEDTLLERVLLEGWKVEGGARVSDYGLQVGKVGTGNATGGDIKLIDVFAGHCKKANLWFKNITDVQMIGGTVWGVDPVTYPESKAPIVLEGGIGSPAWWPCVSIYGVWVENSSNKPNILIENTRIERLRIYGVSRIQTGAYPCIYSNLNPAMYTLTLDGSFMQRADGEPLYVIQVPCDELIVRDSALVRGGAFLDETAQPIDFSNVTRASIRLQGSYNIWTKNLNYLLSNDKFLWGRKTDGTHIQLLGVFTDNKAHLGSGGAGVDMIVQNNLDFQNILTAKNLPSQSINPDASHLYVRDNVTNNSSAQVDLPANTWTDLATKQVTLPGTAVVRTLLVIGQAQVKVTNTTSRIVQSRLMRDGVELHGWASNHVTGADYHTHRSIAVDCAALGGSTYTFKFQVFIGDDTGISEAGRTKLINVVVLN